MSRPNFSCWFGMLACTFSILFLLVPITRADEIDDLFTRANKANDGGDPDLAITICNRILSLDGRQAGAYVERSLAYLIKDDYQRAIADSNRALSFNSPDLTTKDEATAYNNRGAAYQHLHKYQKALADFKRALALNPKDPIFLANISLFFSSHPNKKMRDGQKAWKYAKRAVEMSNSPTPYMYTALASAFAECEDFEAAIKYQKKALESSESFSKNDLEDVQQALKAYKQSKMTYWPPENEDQR